MTVCSRALVGGLLALGLSALAACGGGGIARPVALLADGGAFTGSASLEDTSGAFALTVSADSFLGDEPAGDFSLAVSSAGDELVATIAVSGADNLRALYCELSYDAARYTPLSIEHLPMRPHAGADDDEMLTLAVLDRPGVVHIGQVLAHWGEQLGITGNGELARVRFARRPFTADAARTVSTALTSSGVGPKLELSLTHKKLRWDYYYPGDYNQDGLVGVSDLTPLGAHLDERGDSLGQWYDEELEEYVPLGYAFPLDSLLHVIDGSGDGFITVSDITQIGQHFDEGVAAFTLYESAIPSRDMPQANGEPSTILPLATIPFSTAQGQAGQERIWFNLPLPAARDGYSYWLRPLKDAAEGTPSNAVRYDMGFAESFWLDIQPDTYLGGGTLEEARLEFKDGPAGLVADIWLEGAELMHDFIAELHYAPTLYSYVDARVAADGPSSTPANDPAHSEMTRPQASGQRLIYARIPHGFSGSGYLVRLYFAREPEDEFSNYRLAHWDDYYQPRMMLAYDPLQRSVSWYYFNVGDYNQDGSVWFDDILQIGRHYDTMADFYPELFDPTRIEYLVDGTQDGFIGLQDLTPIGYNEGDSIDGYFVYMGPVPAAEPGPDPLGYVSLSEAEGDPFNERLRFSFHVDAPLPGQQLWVRPEFRGEIGEIPEGAVVEIPAE